MCDGACKWITSCSAYGEGFAHFLGATFNVQGRVRLAVETGVLRGWILVAGVCLRRLGCE